MIGQILLAAFAGWVLCVLLKWLYDELVTFRGIPQMGPRWPLVGHLPIALKHKDHFLDLNAAVHKRNDYCNVVCFQIMSSTRYFVYGERDIEYMLKDNFENFAVGVGQRFEAMGELTGDGIFTSDGPHWLIQRKLASREFSASRLRDFMSGVFSHHATKLTKVIERAIDTGDGVVDLHRLFFTLTMDAFAKIAFGIDVGGLDGKENKFAYAFDWCQKHCIDRAIHMPYWKLFKALQIGSEAEFKRRVGVLDEFVYGLIDTVQQQKTTNSQEQDEQDDLLHRLLPVAKNDDGTYDRKLIRDMVLNLFVAGRDTTAAGMSWTMYELMLNPDILDQARTECFEVMHDGVATFDTVADCHYLHACLSEGQRLNPSVATDPKHVVADCVLPQSGVKLRAGDTAIYVNYALGRSRKLWGEDAEVFKPSRWIDTNTGKYRGENPYKYPAFQAGARMCLGIDMAYLEMKIVLSTLLRKFNFSLVDPKEVHYQMGLVTLMKNGMRVKCERRL